MWIKYKTIDEFDYLVNIDHISNIYITAESVEKSDIYQIRYFNLNTNFNPNNSIFYLAMSKDKNAIMKLFNIISNNISNSSKDKECVFDLNKIKELIQKESDEKIY